MADFLNMLPPSFREAYNSRRELTEEEKALYYRMLGIEKRKESLPEPEFTKTKRLKNNNMKSMNEVTCNADEKICTAMEQEFQDKLHQFEKEFYDIIKPYENSHNYKKLCIFLKYWQHNTFRWLNWHEFKKRPKENGYAQ